MKAPISGALILGLGNAIRVVAQVAMAPVLASILGPQQFGLMALAMPFVLFINLFSHGGLEKVIARQHQLDDELISTAFWVSSLIGAGLALVVLCLAIAAPLVPHGGDLQPLLFGLLPVLVLSALCTTPNGAIIRHQRFRAFATADIASTLLGGGIAIALALHGWGVWALVAQQNVLWLTRLVIVLAMSGVRPARHFKPRLLMGHAGFAAATLGIDVAEFLGRSLDNVLIGFFLGPGALAIYAMAYQLISAPALLVSGPIYVAIFATFSRLSHEGAPVAEAYLEGLRVVGGLVTPILIGMGLVGDPALGLLLGEEWHDTSRLLRFLVPAGFCFCFMSVNSALFVATGEARMQLRIALCTNAALIIAILIGVSFQHRWIVATCVSTALALSLTVAWMIVARTINISFGRLLDALRGPAGGGAALLGSGLLVETSLPEAGGWQRVAVVAAIGAFAYAAGLAAATPVAFRQDLRYIQQLAWRLRRQPLPPTP